MGGRTSREMDAVSHNPAPIRLERFAGRVEDDSECRESVCQSPVRRGLYGLGTYREFMYYS